MYFQVLSFRAGIIWLVKPFRLLENPECKHNANNSYTKLEKAKIKQKHIWGKLVPELIL